MISKNVSISFSGQLNKICLKWIILIFGLYNVSAFSVMLSLHESFVAVFP